ncbi:MAG: DUF4838 domain-containing protein [Clostridia bacterium]|nr:DUF4838 domain-containing protein [Clostridia bacterium]
MKKIIKTLSIIMSVIFLVSASACKKEEGGYNPPPKEEIQFSDYAFVVDGKTDYKLVMPQNPSQKEIIAQTEFNDIIKLSIGTTLDVVYDNEVVYTPQSQYIFIGHTRFLQEFNINPTTQEIGEQGYIVKSVDKSIVITGATTAHYGTLYGVYEFLSYQVDFECYDATETYVKEYTDVNLVKIDIQEKPAINNMWASGQLYKSDATFARRHRFVSQAETFVGGMSPYHTSFLFLNPNQYQVSHPEWYETTGQQLCWTAGGIETESYQEMVDTLFNNFLDYVLKYEDIQHIGFSLQDKPKWCTCDGCDEIVEKYGAESASCILLLNNVSKKFEEYFNEHNINREIDFMFLAYYDVVSPPAIRNDDGTYSPSAPEVVCRDNVYPFFAPISTIRTAPLTDDKNATTYAQIEGWDAVCSKMAFWMYSCNYNNYLIPYNPYDSMQSNYKYLATKNPVFFLDECVGDTGATGFTRLKTYLKYKFTWDLDADMNALIDDYFAHYFQDAAEPMMNYFNEYRAVQVKLFAERGYDFYEHNSISTTDFSYGLLMGWMNYIEQAYESIEYLKLNDYDKYDKLYKRILLESLCVRYTLIRLYEDKFNENEVKQMKSQFKQDCATVNLREFSQYSTIEELWK